MGVSKANLPFGPELMLARVVRLLSEVTYPIVVVAARGQQLPQLPPFVRLVHDGRQGCGPLEGIRAGLEYLQDRADAAYVTGCDAPRLQSDVVRVLAERLAGYRIVVPVDGTLLYPLSAVYTTNLLPEIRELLSADRLRPAFLFDIVRTYYVPVEELRAVDPDLGTLHNLNHPTDYRTALQCCGFGLPREFEKLT